MVLQLVLFEGLGKIILIDYSHVAYLPNMQISTVFESCSKTSEVILPLERRPEPGASLLYFEA